jgi:O-antigen ligase
MARRTPVRSASRSSERFVVAVGVGITAVFVVSLFGKPLYGLPVLLAPVAWLLLRNLHRDAVAVLSLYVVLLILVPSVLIVDPLGASGTPANILGIFMLWWWWYSRGVPGFGVATGPSPVRYAVYGLGVAVILSYAALAFRPVLPIEISAADRGILFLAGCAGITLLATDGIESRQRLDVLLRRLGGATAVLATIGIYQWITAFDINDFLQIPGLKQNQQLQDLVERSTFNRVAGTAAHPIEFGVVLAMVLPLALHFALHSTGWSRRRWWLATGLIAVGIPMAVSRSAIVGLVVAMVVIVPTWPRRWIVRGIAVLAAFLVALQFVIPGLLATIGDLFLRFGDDPSTTSRTQDYTVFARLYAERPIFGRGFFTFLPDVYTTFDNEYLVILLEVGIIGLLALIVLFVAGMGAGRAARHAARDEETRHLGQVLAGSIAAGAVAFGTFDAFSFPMAAGTTFLLIGTAGALRRLTREAHEAQEAQEAPPAVVPSAEAVEEPVVGGDVLELGGRPAE